MFRVEIICDATIEDEYKEGLHGIGPELYYTSVSPVRGRGKKGQRQGDSVWPEENALFFIYTDAEGLDAVRALTAEIRERFPRSGVAAFSVAQAQDF
jgi:nitrogen regulatory protein PII